MNLTKLAILSFATFSIGTVAKADISKETELYRISDAAAVALYNSLNGPSVVEVNGVKTAVLSEESENVGLYPATITKKLSCSLAEQSCVFVQDYDRAQD